MRNRRAVVVAGLMVLGVLLGLVLVLAACGGGQQSSTASLKDAAQAEKEQFTLQVSVDYASDHDLAKARGELERLGVPNVGQWVAQMAETYIREGRDEQEAENLITLAEALGVVSAPMVAYLATETPVPTDTPRPTATPTDTPTPTATPQPTDTPTSAPTETPTDTPVPPTDTATVPPPTNTPAPPTRTPKPKATSTPKPTATPAIKWSWTARLVSVGEDSQRCGAGNLQIRVTVLDANGQQLNGVWVYDKYSNQYMVTGNVASPDWGPGETKYEYGTWGGGSLCIATGQGGPCETEFTRDMPCFAAPPFEDMWAAGWCQCCSPDAASNKAVCQQLYDSHHVCMGAGHYSWRVVYKRSW